MLIFAHKRYRPQLTFGTLRRRGSRCDDGYYYNYYYYYGYFYSVSTNIDIFTAIMFYVFASCWSLVQRSSTFCGVSEYDRAVSINHPVMFGHRIKWRLCLYVQIFLWPFFNLYSWPGVLRYCSYDYPCQKNNTGSKKKKREKLMRDRKPWNLIWKIRFVHFELTEICHFCQHEIFPGELITSQEFEKVWLALLHYLRVNSDSDIDRLSILKFFVFFISRSMQISWWYLQLRHYWLLHRG
jgi:hypothetical protein